MIWKPIATAGLLLSIGQSIGAATVYPQRSVGVTDPKQNVVLDAAPDGIRTLPPVLLYPKGATGFETWPGKLAGATEMERRRGRV